MVYDRIIEDKANKVMSGTGMQTYDSPWPLRCGSIRKRIIRVSPEHIAKLVPNWDLLEGDDEARKIFLMGHLSEYHVQEQVYAAGVRVPKLEGMFEIPMKRGILNPFSKKITVPGMVMQYIPGRTIGKLKGDLADRARDSEQEELEKARRFGFEPRDTNAGNAIWHPEEEVTYLIDMAQWLVKGKG